MRTASLVTVLSLLLGTTLVHSQDMPVTPPKSVANKWTVFKSAEMPSGHLVWIVHSTHDDQGAADYVADHLTGYVKVGCGVLPRVNRCCVCAPNKCPYNNMDISPFNNCLLAVANDSAQQRTDSMRVLPSGSMHTLEPVTPICTGIDATTACSSPDVVCQPVKCERPRLFPLFRRCR